MTKLLFWTLMGGVFVIALGVLIIYLPFTMQIRYRRNGEKDDFVVNWLLFGIPFKLINLPKVDVKSEKTPPTILVRLKKLYQRKAHQSEQRVDRFFTVFTSAWPRLKRLLRIIRLEKRNFCLRQLRWETRVGARDALDTALIAGSLWSFKYMLVAWLDRFVDDVDHRPRVNVVPLYGGKRLDVSLDFVFTIRPGHIIVVGLWNAGYFPGNMPKAFDKNRRGPAEGKGERREEKPRDEKPHNERQQEYGVPTIVPPPRRYANRMKQQERKKKVKWRE
ncbi:DUF2953 domain-containing protein [Heliobacterium gestii]|uniref:DUF2953 domain-containing protein n=1 Tax=Heliomicrobium gestii TaxID=2699 RepID=A0A845L510_HELGE|nr:DUF2953 domain-containing protein [Heliomicrobium gestii]MBM7865421.1 hypothetical protein [Heliomicrobium gestii]MZP41677.1 DUF2953 domain-containing protein [Heliomicrobium gestii]